VLTILPLLLPALWVYLSNFATALNLALENSGTKAIGDQQAIYQALQSALNGNANSAITEGWMPSGYIALLGFYHQLSKLWGDASLDQTFFISGVLFGMLAAQISVLFMYRVAVDQSPISSHLHLAWASSVFWFAMFKLSGILRFLYLPWSHYASTFVALAFSYAFYEICNRSRSPWYLIATFSGTLFWLTRRHEAMAVFLVCSILCMFLIVTRTPDLFRTGSLRQHYRAILLKGSLAILGVLLAYGFVLVFAHGMPLNSHYAQQRLSNTWLNEYMKLYPQMIPLRIIQTFIDPNYFSFDNTYRVHPIVTGTFGTDDFSMPLIFQLPILLYLVPLALFVCGSIFVKTKARSWLSSPAERAFFIGFGSFVVLTSGYLATGVWGGAHLKHGLIREFILSILLLSIACGPGITLWLAARIRRKSLAWIIPTLGILVLPINLGQLMLPNTEFEITSRHLSPIHAMYVCGESTCKIELDVRDRSNNAVTLPFDYNIVHFVCSSGFKGTMFTGVEAAVTVRGQKFDFEIPECADKLKVEIHPLFAGRCASGMQGLEFSICSGNSLNCESSRQGQL
jgi:hypothetical protein